MLDFVNLCMLTSFCALSSSRAAKLYSAPSKSPGALVMVGTQIPFLYAFTCMFKILKGINEILCVCYAYMAALYCLFISGYRDLDEALPVESTELGMC